MAVAGTYAMGGPNYQFTTGPDGKQYAVGGEIRLNTSSIPNNPSATVNKAIILRRGALAPSDPSGADLAVAAAASQMETQARQKLTAQSQKENKTTF